ncbi:efflux RND transporter permease subunit [Alcanivorax sp. IL3]|uniref:efflux RND transporter permease subunit n=1 Tax=Alcanivorax TaxID=59753 RepID=UPI000C3F8EE7|nr:MMPL family transporter [Alcanivorax jadensis]MBP22851.1 transporter [Alcanivorax sp.]MDF1636075.1 MMPL family transporter [Alcanivorax jadensis]
MTHRLFNAYCRVVLAHPVFWLALLALLCAVSAWQAREFKIDASADSLVLENDEALQYYRKISKRYGGSDFLIITYTPSQAPLFQRDTLTHLQALQNDLKQVDRVSSVYSMLDVPLLFSPQVEFSDLANDYRTLTDQDVDLSLAEKEFTEENPLYEDLLVSDDGNTTALLVSFERDEKYYELLYQRNELRTQQHEGQLDEDGEQALEEASQAFSDYSSQIQERTAGEIDQVRDIMDSYRDEAKLFLGGVPMIATDLVRFIRADLKIFGIGVLAFLIVTLFMIFRRPRWVIVPLACCGVTVLTVTGWLGWMDWKVSVISSNYISLLLIITMSITIHLTVRFRELHEENPDASQKWLIRETAAHMMRPMIYMILTTMVGFSSLVISGIRPVIDFGWMMTFGLGVSLVVCFLVFPALLGPLKAGQPQQGRDFSRKFTLAFADFTERHRPTLMVLAIITVIASLWGVSRLTVENRFIDYFQKDTEIYQGMLQIDRKLGGTTPLDIVIDAPSTEAQTATASSPPATGWDGESMDDSAATDPFAAGDDSDPFASAEPDPFAEGDSDPFSDASGSEDPFASAPSEDPFAESKQAKPNPLKGAYWFTPARLAQLVEIQNYLQSLPETGKVLSIATTYKVAEKLNEGPLSYVQLMLLASFIPEDLRDQLVRPYLSDDGNQVRFSVRVIDSDENLNRNELLAKIRTDMENNFGLQPEQVHLTGAMVLYNNMLQSLFDSQIKTLGYVFAAILVMLLILFRSLPVALISMVPSLISASLVLGLMGWIGLPLDLMTITITAITIGIAVDDTIHYIHRFHEELPKDNDYVATMKRCHGSIGKAMYYTSLTIIAGFSILAFSNFNPTVYFGLLTGLAMLVALLSNLTLLPALLISVKPKLRAG